VAALMVVAAAVLADSVGAALASGAGTGLSVMQILQVTAQLVFM
jgi:hypothetical protein